MTLVVIILSVCLVLALAAGVGETCIASYNIRRARRAESKIRDAEAKEERATSILERAEKQAAERQQDLAKQFASVVENFVKPNRAAFIKTAKAAHKSGKTERVNTIISLLSSIKNVYLQDEEARQYVSDLMNDLQNTVDGVSDTE